MSIKFLTSELGFILLDGSLANWENNPFLILTLYFTYYYLLSIKKFLIFCIISFRPICIAMSTIITITVIIIPIGVTISKCISVSHSITIIS
jgi:hypothetical protein